MSKILPNLQNGSVDNSTYNILFLDNNFIYSLLCYELAPKEHSAEEQPIRRLAVPALPEPQLLLPAHLYPLPYAGNRCHIQTKQQNAYMNYLYQQHIELANEHPHLVSLAIDSFPNVLLLMINDDPWEEEQRREAPETLNVKWINNLIEE